MKKYILAGSCLLFSLIIHAQSVQPNIIFIIFDDLNTDVSGYNTQPQSITPAIEEIANNGTTFTNAFCNAPECAPSRTSFITGKLPYYTELTDNNEYLVDFRTNFSADKYILTFPQYLKDSAGYFTVSGNKIFHQDQFDPDYDAVTTDACEKTLSWSKVIHSGNIGSYGAEAEAQEEGIGHFPWACMDSSWDTKLEDYTLTDSVIDFIADYAADAGNFCNKPFFLGVGYHFPHLNMFVPENYFLPYYIKDFSAEPFTIPYNHPAETFPYNGLVMPPQPEVPWSDYYALGYMGKQYAAPYIHEDFFEWYDTLTSIPVPLAGLPETTIESILTESKRANAVMAYLAAIQYADAQVKRLIDTLQAYPEILNNTIIIVTSDHGYSLGQKKHWKKSALWETDIHIPFIISDYRDIHKQSCDAAVSLIDLFPTFCDFAGVPAPVFPDGTDYTDGSSLVPLLENPEMVYNKPVVISIQNTETGNQGTCYPQLSIRTNSLHYILYKSNSAEDEIGPCNDLLSFNEEEFYDIGIHRTNDPYEWNNLKTITPACNSYFAQWLPGGNHYLSFSPSLFLQYTVDSCNIIDNSAVLQLTSVLYDADGNLLSSIPDGNAIEWYDKDGTFISSGSSAFLNIADAEEVNISSPLAYALWKNTADDSILVPALLNIGKEELKSLMIDCSTDHASDLENTIKLYPNPASTSIFLEADYDSVFKKITIYDMKGARIASFTNVNVHPQLKINTQLFAQGLYKIVLESETGILISEFVITKN